MLAAIDGANTPILKNNAFARLLREYAVRMEHVEFVYGVFLRGDAYKNIARHAEEVLTGSSGSGKWLPSAEFVVESLLTELERPEVLQDIPRDLCLVRIENVLMLRRVLYLHARTLSLFIL